MGYKSATNVLPAYLVSEIQKYVDGEYLYIPSCKRKNWGSKNGTKAKLAQRDFEIYQDHKNGVSMELLCCKYCLSIKCVEKILTSQRKQEN
ncbi:CD3324 family protein [Flavonifractor porci]|uniref:CD3324 family protein n=1 Tax=Flavonifractor porci TaxID=3133422 RepID=UPI003CCC78DC